MSEIVKAVEYITANPSLSFYYVAVKFDVDVQKLREEYIKSRAKGSCNV